jgi:phage N-6-adenine-methyltransferase
MGTEQIGMGVVGASRSIEYSTPLEIVNPLIEEFSLTRDVCASKENYKLDNYWTIDDDALSKTWDGNCWMNPPFNRKLRTWVRKAHSERYSGTKVCLFPVRANTKWWAEVCVDSEIRFINGEVNFNNEPRGLWAAMCIMIFGEQAKVGTFSVIDYRKKRTTSVG